MAPEQTSLTDLQDALLRSEERFRIAAESTADIVIEWDLVTNTIEHFGSWRSPLPPRPVELEAWIERLHPEDREAVMAKVDALRRDGVPFNSDHRLLNDDGGWSWVRVRGQTLRDNEGRPVRWIGALTDMSEQRQAEHRYLDALNLLEGVVDGSPEPIYVKNRDGEFVMLNPAAAAVLRTTPAGALGRRSEEFLPPEVAARFNHVQERVLAEQRPLTAEIDAPSASVPQSPATYLVTTAPFRNAAGEITGTVGIAHDVTEQRRLAEQLRQAQKMEAIGRLAGGIAHDFNNLLTVIIGYAEEIELSSNPVDLAIAAAELKAAGMRAAQLTRQLLAFSRRQVLNPVPTNVNENLTALERMLKRIVGEDVTIRTTLDPELGMVNIDPGQFDQVVLNLAVNARDAMPHGGVLTITSRNLELDARQARLSGVIPGQYVQIAVGDTGVGIPPEAVGRIFEPFFTTKGQAGNGFGLATVYGIVKQSGGEIAVESRGGAGTCFTVTLPQITAAPAARDAARAQPAAPSAGGESILLVEDDEATRAFVASALRHRGYHVEAYGDSREARRRVRSGVRFDLVLTDVVMPHGTGVQLADKVRQAQPDCKVLLMSGYAGVSPGGDAPIAGWPFLQKPFTPSELAAKVRSVLGG